MQRDQERITRVRDALAANGLDALVCALPSNVLLLAGFWPVIGNSIAVFTRQGAVGLIVPEDEYDHATNSWADTIRTFQSGSLDNLNGTFQNISAPLREVKRALGMSAGSSVGFEGGPSFDPSTYASSYVYGPSILEVLHASIPEAHPVDARECLIGLRSVLTPRELELLRRACDIAREAFSLTFFGGQAGLREFEIAALLKSHLMTGADENKRSDGFSFCMSGPNSAKAHAAFQHSSSRCLVNGDFVLIHCNSHHGGFWTDITRTFLLGSMDSQKSGIATAVLEASCAAMGAVRAGVKASSVDAAAREVLRSHGYTKEFKHATGHGVGFAAINHNARPRIHPLSEEMLETGMVFNIEPAVYIPELGGMRHCNMVAVQQNGCELLSDFLNDREALAWS